VWEKSLDISANLTQNQFSNWNDGRAAKTRTSDLAWVLISTGQWIHKTDRREWTLTEELKYGRSRKRDALKNFTTTEIEDEIDLESLWAWFIWKRDKGVSYDPFFSLQLDSVFTDLGDPLTLTQSAGIRARIKDTKPFKLNTRLGFFVKEIFSNKQTSFTDDPATAKIEKSRIDGGLESVTGLRWTIRDGLKYVSELKLQTGLKDSGKIDAAWDNSLSFSVFKYLGVKISWTLASDQSDRNLQYKQSTLLSFQYKLF
jgi:hypothetical protein